MKCIYGCRHPLWGGAGACVDQESGIGEICLCEDGFASRDSFGNPSCVAPRVLLACYYSIAAVGTILTAFLTWDVKQHRQLPQRVQASRRMAARLRLTVASRWGIGLTNSTC